MTQRLRSALGGERHWAGRLVVLMLVLSLALAACAAPAPAPAPPAGDATSEATAAAAEGDTIKVGILHSLSGTMAISEVSVKDAELLAIEEINAAGGVIGKQIEPIVEDGASDWPTFAEKARKLIEQDKVAVVFGGWTSASRKAMLPVFEELNGLLFYPVQYEGLESSPNIFYTGAEPTSRSSRASTTWSRTWAPRASTCSVPTTSSPAPPTRSSRRSSKTWA